MSITGWVLGIAHTAVNPPAAAALKLYKAHLGSPKNKRLQKVLNELLPARAEWAALEAAAAPLMAAIAALYQPGLDQMPFSRPASWGQRSTVIRLPPNLRPLPEDSTETEA